jgi:hypothetical protein
VLNPIRSVDQHIMDDTDLAGPILFCLLFATFLLFVQLPSVSLLLTQGREKSFRICLWLYPVGHNIIAFHIEPHVSNWR